MKRIKRTLTFFNNSRRLILKELKSEIRVSFGKRLSCYIRGFLAESYIIYDFRKNKKNNYLSDYTRFIKIPTINIDFAYLLDNKFIFDNYFSELCNIIKNIGLIYKGKVYNKNLIRPVFDLIFELTNENKGVVIKTLSGGGGSDILFIEKIDGSFHVNKNKFSLEEIETRVNSLNGYILYERFFQKGFSHNITPGSLNTIRIITMIDPITGIPFIPIAIHRFGTLESGCVDNWSKGGLCAEIDISTGIMGKAVSYPKSGKLIWYSKHPDSGIRIEGRQLPEWEKIKETVLLTAEKVSMIPYIGWDIVLSDNEIFFLEGNTNSDVNLLQVHKPLLSIPGVKNFFAYYKIY